MAGREDGRHSPTAEAGEGFCEVGAGEDFFVGGLTGRAG
jgi:hypothetical protein